MKRLIDEMKQTNLRTIIPLIPTCLMTISFHACIYCPNPSSTNNGVNCVWDKTFIRINASEETTPQYMFFNCHVRNHTSDTLNWHYLGFNQGYFGELTSDYTNKAFIKLKTGDSLPLYQESYESNEIIKIAPNDSLQILLSLDEFRNDPAYASKSRFDSIEHLIENIVYYTEGTRLLFQKSTNYQYISIETETFEEGDGMKTTLPLEIINHNLR